MIGPRALLSVAPETTAAQAVELLQASGIAQLPVLRDGRAVGSIQEVTLARLLHDDVDPATVPVGDVMARPLPQVDVTVHLTKRIGSCSPAIPACWQWPARRSSTSSRGST